jgi:hypothetical protein
MKKIVTASLLAIAAAASSAAEIGIINTHEYGVIERSAPGISLGTTIGGVGVVAAFERFSSSNVAQDRLSVTASKPLFSAGPFKVSAKAGMAHLKNNEGVDGYTFTAGAGVDLPLTKEITLTVDATRQRGQSRVSEFNGNRYTAGVKYSF